MKWGQVLDSMLINLNAPDHSVPSFSVFDWVCVWTCGSAGKYVISAVSLPVYGSHRVLLLRSPFQSGSVPRSAVSWQLPAMDVSKAAATQWPGTVVGAGTPPFSGFLYQTSQLGWQPLLCAILQPEALFTSSSFTDVRPAWWSEGSPCLPVIHLPFSFDRW